MLPDDAPIQQAPAGKAAAVLVTDVGEALRFIRAHQATGQSKAELQAVLKAEAVVTNDEGHWVRINEYLVYTPDDGLTQEAGPLLRTGYLLHRNRQGVVKAVSEPLWCD